MNRQLVDLCQQIKDAFQQIADVPAETVAAWQSQEGASGSEAIRRAQDIVQTMQQYLEGARTLYAGQYNLQGLDAPPVNEESIRAAEQYLGSAENVNFVLNPPKSFFALKPKEEDVRYFILCADILARYYAWKAERMADSRRTAATTPEQLRRYEAQADKALINTDSVDWYDPDAIQDDTLYVGNLLNPMEPSAARMLSQSRWFDGEQLSLPFTYQAGQPFSLFVDCASQEEATARARAGGLVCSLLYQITRGMKPYSYQFYHIDPRGGGSSLNALSGLKSVVNGCAYQLHGKLFENHRYEMLRSAGTQAAATEMMQELDGYIANAITICGGETDIAAHNARQIEAGQQEGEEIINLVPQRFVIFENIHGVIGSRERDTLCKAIDNARKCGISVIVTSCRQEDAHASPKKEDDQHDKEEAALRARCSDIILWNDTCCQVQISAATMGEPDTGSSDAPKRYLYPFAPPAFGIAASQEYVASLQECFKPRVNFDTLYEHRVDIDAAWGACRGDDAITIPIGINTAGRVSSIALGNSKAAHILLNGTTGCGKSTLLHDIINGIIIHYHPDDVQIWLSDYKSNEFMRYVEQTPPHIRYVATDTSREYSFSFLERIWAEYLRRQELFGSITSVAQYRKVHGPGSLPRLLIIIDEFHVLSDHIKTEPKYREMLERLLREVRAFGMTFLMADQTGREGLRGLTDNAQKQLNFRMSMVAEKEDYNAAFDIKNAQEIPEIATLVPHQVALRRSREELNELGQKVPVYYFEQCSTLYLTPEMRDSLTARSIESYGACQDPVFVLRPERVPADWAEVDSALAGCAEPDETPVCLGIPTSAQKFAWFSFGNNFRENLMCIGSNAAMQASVLEACLDSIARSGQPSEVYVLADPHAKLEKLCRSWMRARQVTDPYFHLVMGNERLCAAIWDLWREKERRRMEEDAEERRLFVVWLGLEDMCQNLAYFKGTEPSARAGSMLYDATDHIKELMEVGPNYSIHQLVFYQSVSAIRMARCARLESFRHKIAFTMGREEGGDFLGTAKPLQTADEKTIDDETAVYYDGKDSIQFKPFIGAVEAKKPLPEALLQQAELTEREQEQAFRERKARWLTPEPEQPAAAQEEQHDSAASTALDGLSDSLFEDIEPMSPEEEQAWFAAFEKKFAAQAESDRPAEPPVPQQPLRLWYVWDGYGNRQLTVCNSSSLDYGWDAAGESWVRLTPQMYVFDQPTNSWQPLTADAGGRVVLP